MNKITGGYECIDGIDEGVKNIGKSLISPVKEKITIYYVTKR